MTAKLIPILKRPERSSVFLFAAPWMKASWPSLALGCLKSFLQQADVKVRCCHLHLEAATRIGWSRYDALSEVWGAGEALFGALLDPEDSHRLVSVAVQILQEAKQPALADWAAKSACNEMRELVDEWLDRECPDSYPLVGGSVGAMQLCSTLYLMKRVHERGHAGRRVLGGSGVVGTVGRQILERCPYIDAVVDGEGEHALLELARQVGTGGPFVEVPRVLSREAHGSDHCSGPTVDLSATVPADLDDYFSTAAHLGVPRTALTLPFEHSRGCEWEHRTPGKLRGCTFCGLYRNSPNHRRKPVTDVIQQIEGLVERYKVLNLAFVDAYLPVDYRDELLDRLNLVSADISFFTEMRCDLTRMTAQRLAARSDRVQLGVESFSSNILRRIGKGIGAAKTIYSLRLCQEYGIPVQYNLMTDIPGVPKTDVDELNNLLPFLFGLFPPNVAEFYLDRNSLIFAEPECYAMQAQLIDAERPSWLALSLGDSRISQVVPFRSADVDAQAAWGRLKTRVSEWRECWRAAVASGVESPLFWRDGGGWASVVDTRDRIAHIYLLEGVLYDVFIQCSDVTSESALKEALPSYSAEILSETLLQLATRGLVFRDGAQCVALPIRASIGNRQAFRKGPADVGVDSGTTTTINDRPHATSLA